MEIKVNMNEVFALEEKLNSNAIYPCTLVMDRYDGVYSKAKWNAFNLEPSDIPSEVGGGDYEELEIWDKLEEDGELVGQGNTPNEAVLDLERLIERQKERIAEEERTTGHDTYIVHYFYGGQGNVEWNDVAEVECDSAKEAIDKYIEYDNRKHPKRIEHEDFHRGCLTAFKKGNRPNGIPKKSRFHNNRPIVKL